MNGEITRLPRTAIWPATALMAACAIGAWFAPKAFFEVWLVAWIFWSGLSFGGLILLMLQALTGGAWAQAVRSPCLALFGTVPAAAVLFVPVLLGAQWIYPWTDREIFVQHHWPHKEFWLTLPFFTARAIIVFAVFATLSVLLRRWSASADEKAQTRNLRAASCIGLILYFILMTFAATDWVMSLTPQWYSTLFPTLLMTGQFLSALAFLIFVRCRLGGSTPKPFHDLGNLLLAFVVFWTYVSFSQFLLIWYGNVPREISWYLERCSKGWQFLALTLVLIQFLLTFVLLLSREVKSDPRRLGRIAALVFCANILNVYWLVEPSFSPERIAVHWLDPLVFLAVGSVWTIVFLRNLSRLPIATEVAPYA